MNIIKLLISKSFLLQKSIRPFSLKKYKPVFVYDINKIASPQVFRGKCANCHSPRTDTVKINRPSEPLYANYQSCKRFWEFSDFGE